MGRGGREGGEEGAKRRRRRRVRGLKAALTSEDSGSILEDSEMKPSKAVQWEWRAPVFTGV